MDFSEALKAMMMGSKVARRKWQGTVAYWRIEGNRIIQATPGGNEHDIFEISTEYVLAEDWWIVP